MNALNKKEKFKSSDAEVESRVVFILKLMFNGIRQRSDILQYITKLDKSQDNGWISWNVSESMIDKYMAAAKLKYRKAADQDTKELLGMLSLRYDDLYQKSMKISDYKTCLSISKEMADRFGVGENIDTLKEKAPSTFIFNFGDDKQVILNKEPDDTGN